MATATTVEAYLAALPEDRRRVLAEIRRVVVAAAPDATETIAYGMPALRTRDGQFLVSYDAYKAHYSLFPASGMVIERLGAEIRPYLAGRGTLRFPANRAVPLDLVRKVVGVRVAELATRKRR